MNIARAAAILRLRADSYAQDAQQLFQMGDWDSWSFYDTIARELRDIAKGLEADA